MSREIIHTKFGQTVKIRDKIVQVNHVASTQQYIISPKDAANQPSFFSHENNITHGFAIQHGFQEGELIIHHRNEDTTININSHDTLHTIANKITDTAKVFANVTATFGGSVILVESTFSGLENTFHITGDAIQNLSVAVPEDAIKCMDIYSITGKMFKSPYEIKGDECGSFRAENLMIGYGTIHFTDGDLSSLYWMKQRINAKTIFTNIAAKIVCESEGFILRLHTKIGNHFIGYTDTYSSIFRGPKNIQLKYHSAQDTEIIINNIPDSSPFSHGCEHFHIEALGDNVTISITGL